MKFDDPTTWPPTWRERCVIISEMMTFTREAGAIPEKWTPDQIFGHYPTGELFQLNGWFVQCLVRREAEERIAAGEDPQAVDDEIMARANKLYIRWRDPEFEG